MYAACAGTCVNLRRSVAVPPDLFHVPVWALQQSSAGHMVLTLDDYPVAQGSEQTCLLHPHLPQAFIQARR